MTANDIVYRIIDVNNFTALKVNGASSDEIVETFSKLPEESLYDVIYFVNLSTEEAADLALFKSMKHLRDNGCLIVFGTLPQNVNYDFNAWRSITKLGIYGVRYITVDCENGATFIKKADIQEPPLCELTREEFQSKKDMLMRVVSEDYVLNTPFDLLWDNYYKNFYEIRLNEDMFSRLFRKDENDKEKYLVFTCAKNENTYLKEWIEHYLSLGFDKIIICDNNDDNVLDDFLRDYIENGTVELFDFRGCSSFQVHMYSIFARYGNYKWCAYFDCDEFLEINCYTNIKDFLETINEDCVSFNWLVYGSNGEKHRKDGTVQERFKEPVYPVCMFKENMFIKSILRGSDKFRNCWFNGSHIPMYCVNDYNIGGYYITDNYSHEEFPPRYKLGYIKHYYTKSFDEWVLKAQRGWPDGTVNLNAANFFICEDSTNVPISMYGCGFFGGDGTPPWVEEVLSQYDVVNVINSSKCVYPWLMGLIRMFMYESGHTYIISDEHIDDTLYNICFEYAIRTGNNLVYARNGNEIWNAYLKYNKGKNKTYYIVDLQ